MWPSLPAKTFNNYTRLPSAHCEVFVTIAKDWVHNCTGTYREGESFTIASITLLWVLDVQSYIQHFICTKNQGEVGIKKWGNLYKAALYCFSLWYVYITIPYCTGLIFTVLFKGRGDNPKIISNPKSILITYSLF